MQRLRGLEGIALEAPVLLEKQRSLAELWRLILGEGGGSGGSGVILGFSVYGVGRVVSCEFMRVLFEGDVLDFPGFVGAHEPVERVTEHGNPET